MQVDVYKYFWKCSLSSSHTTKTMWLIAMKALHAYHYCLFGVRYRWPVDRWRSLQGWWWRGPVVEMHTWSTRAGMISSSFTGCLHLMFLGGHSGSCSQRMERDGPPPSSVLEGLFWNQVLLQSSSQVVLLHFPNTILNSISRKWSSADGIFLGHLIFSMFCGVVDVLGLIHRSCGIFVMISNCDEWGVQTFGLASLGNWIMSSEGFEEWGIITWAFYLDQALSK